jgi:hypothetical protein
MCETFPLTDLTAGKPSVKPRNSQENPADWGFFESGFKVRYLSLMRHMTQGHSW